MRIISLIGARPQFIKVWPISEALDNLMGFEHLVVNSGQHYQPNMSSDFFDELSLPSPRYNLNAGSESHGKQTAKIIEKFEEILVFERPHGVIIYGDTNTTLAGAIATSKLCIPIFHVEAGLRSLDRRMPEEINRITADHLSNLNFAPTHRALENLENEKLGSTGRLVGDVMLDAFLKIKSRHKARSVFEGVYGIMTLHRPSNVDNPSRLRFILRRLSLVPMTLYWPVHPRLNQENIKKIMEEESITNISLVPPMSYIKMIHALKYAEVCLTDSGGLQKESFFTETPTFTLRDSTEWPETLGRGRNYLDHNLDSTDFLKFINKGADSFDQVPLENNLDSFGDGQASKKIVRAISEYLLGS